MIAGLWNKIEIVCGCHSDINQTPLMSLKTGHRSMFYSCPRYYPDGRDASDTACINHVSTDDFQKILDRLSEETEEQMKFGQSSNLIGLSFTIKTINVKVIEHTSDRILISVINKNALLL